MDKAQLVLITLVIYKSVLIGIGVWASKRNRDGDDFFLGGRQLGPVVAALSYSSSAASAWVLLGLSGIAFSFGLSTIWVPLGSIWAMFVVWFWIAPRLMASSRMEQQMTMTEVLGSGLPKTSRKRFAAVASFIIVFSFVFYVAAQFQAAGNTFATSFQLSMPTSIILGAIIIMLYTLIGGFWAVSVTDALQGMLMAFTAVILPVSAYIAVGGIDGLVQSLASQGQSLYLTPSGAAVGWTLLGVVLGGLAIGLGTFGQPHLMVRIMALKDESAMRRARALTIGWYLLVFLGMWFVGLAGRALYPELDNPETIFFAMLDGLLPDVLAAILLAAVLSAIMSTADSQLLAAAAAIAHDLGLGGDNTKRFLLVSRLTVAVLVTVSVWVAIALPERIFSRVLFAWMALGAAFGPLLFARLLGWRISSVGIMGSVLSGFLLTVLLSLFPNTPGDVVERLLPFLLASLVLVACRQKINSKNNQG